MNQGGGGRGCPARDAEGGSTPTSSVRSEEAPLGTPLPLLMESQYSLGKMAPAHRVEPRPANWRTLRHGPIGGVGREARYRALMREEPEAVPVPQVMPDVPKRGRRRADWYHAVYSGGHVTAGEASRIQASASSG